MKKISFFAAALTLIAAALIALPFGTRAVAASVNGTVFSDEFRPLDSEKWEGGAGFERTGAERFYSLAYNCAGGASAVVLQTELPAAYTITVDYIADEGNVRFAFTSETAYTAVAAAAVPLAEGAGRHTVVIEVADGTYTLPGGGTGAAEGRFALVFDEQAKGYVLDVTVKAGDETLLYDTFADERTVSPLFAASADGYTWQALSALAGWSEASRHTLHMTAANELVIYNAGWRTDIAYPGYTFEGGIGAEYTIDATILIERPNNDTGNNWFVWVNNAGSHAPGIANYTAETPLSEAAGLADGGLGSPFGGLTGEGAAASYQINRKMNVRVQLKQTAAGKTDVTIGFRYPNALDDTYHSRTFTYNTPIGGNPMFNLASVGGYVVLYDMSITDADGVRHVCPIGELNTAEQYGEVFFVGLKHNDASCTAEVIGYGAAEDAGRVRITTDTPDGAAITARCEVPARSDIDRREIMYEAELAFTATEIGADSGLDLVLGDTGRYVRVSGTSLAAYGADGLLTEQPVTVTGSNVLHVTAFADGRLTAVLGETTLTCDGFSETDFTGRPAVRAFTRGGAADIALDAFSVTLSGIPSQPTLVLPAIEYVAVGQPTDLTPAVWSDELDAQSELTLTITVTDGQGQPVSVDGRTCTFPTPGDYTIAYRLTNTAGLYAEGQMTVPAILRGSDENAFDKLDDGLNSADNFETDGTVSGGSATLSAGQSLYTKESARWFMAYFDIAERSGSFELVFGNCYDYDNAFGVIFSDGMISGRNLTGEPVAYPLDGFRLPGMVRLTVMGDAVTVSVRAHETPYDLLYKDIAAFSFDEKLPATFGKLGIVAGDGGSIVIDRVRVYSLEAAIDIETEPYEETPIIRHIKPLSPNTALIVGLSVGLGAGIPVLAAVVIVTVILVRKRKRAAAATAGSSSESGSDVGDAPAEADKGE